MPTISKPLSWLPAHLITPQVRRALRWWRRIGLLMNSVGLASLFDNVVKWARWIHWTIGQYRFVRDWAFGLLPFQLPDDWRDSVVIAFVILVTTLKGLELQDRLWLIKRLAILCTFGLAIGLLVFGLDWSAFAAGYLQSGTAILGATIGISIIAFQIAREASAIETPWYRQPEAIAVIVVALALVTWVAVQMWINSTVSVAGAEIAWLIYAWIFAGGFFAWRWTLLTAGAFCALLAINAMYLRLLVPMGY